MSKNSLTGRRLAKRVDSDVLRMPSKREPSCRREARASMGMLMRAILSDAASQGDGEAERLERGGRDLKYKGSVLARRLFFWRTGSLVWGGRWWQRSSGRAGGRRARTCVRAAERTFEGAPRGRSVSFVGVEESCAEGEMGSGICVRQPGAAPQTQTHTRRRHRLAVRPGP